MILWFQSSIELHSTMRIGLIIYSMSFASMLNLVDSSQVEINTQSTRYGHDGNGSIASRQVTGGLRRLGQSWVSSSNEAPIYFIDWAHLICKLDKGDSPRWMTRDQKESSLSSCCKRYLDWDYDRCYSAATDHPMQQHNTRMSQPQQPKHTTRGPAKDKPARIRKRGNDS